MITKDTSSDFHGLRVLALESRRATEVASVIATYGGTPLVAPSLREVPLESDGDGGDGLKVGARVLVEIFEGEKFVDIIGVSKGRGFQGVVKRHHFGGGPKSHGSMFQITGSIGSSAFPSRVFKGMRMSGHMGNSQVTVRNLRVLGVDKDENLLVVEGSVPGPQGGYLVITKAQKPPRERRGFAGAATVDPLKAAKRAAKKA